MSRVRICGYVSGDKYTLEEEDNLLDRFITFDESEVPGVRKMLKQMQRDAKRLRRKGIKKDAHQRTQERKSS